MEETHPLRYSVRIDRRYYKKFFFIFVIPVLFTILFLIILGKNPLEAFYLLFITTLGGGSQLEMITKVFCPILLSSLSVSIVYEAGLINIGVAAQLLFGAFTGFLISSFYSGPFSLILIVLAGMIGGGFIGGIIGILRGKFGVNEVLSGIMLNFIMALFILFICEGPFKDPTAYVPQTWLLRHQLGYHPFQLFMLG